MPWGCVHLGKSRGADAGKFFVGGLIELRRARHPLRTSSWVSLGDDGPAIRCERPRGGLARRRWARHPLRTSSWVSLGGEGSVIRRERPRGSRWAEMGPASAANVVVGLAGRRRARHRPRTSSWVSLGGEGPGMRCERPRGSRWAEMGPASVANGTPRRVPTGRPVNLPAISGRQRGEKFFVTSAGGSSLTR